jgi:tRNA pseudouridine55 synthase
LTTGILLLDKPIGMSSNAALQRVRRMLNASKAGHVGSLDPLATGMLPICLGEATKIAGEIVGGRKRYGFTIGLGARTTTGDREGVVIERGTVPALTSTDVEAVLRRFLGRQKQVPPMFSALKREGRPLYQLARAGLEVERAPREIQLDELLLCGLTPETVSLEVLCSKGTYVRSLAEDISRALGTCGHVTELRRIHVEPFDNEPMETLESVDAAVSAGRAPRIISADQALPHLPEVRLDAAAAVRLGHGQSIVADPGIRAGKVRLYDATGQFLGLGESDGAGTVRPRRLFTQVAAGFFL